MRRGTPLAFALAAAVLLLMAAPASAESGFRVFADEDEAVVHPGGSADLSWMAVSTRDDRGAFVTIAVESDATRGWDISVTPAYGWIEPRGVLKVSVTAVPSGDADPRVLDLRVVLTSGNESEEATGQVRLEGFGSVLGRYDNPLPAPLDGAGGAFALNLAIWLVVSLVVMWLINPTLKLLTMRTRTTLDDRIIAIISRPVFVGLFAFGIKQSIEILPLPAWTYRVVNATWTVLLVVLVVYTVFRLWHEIVLAVGRRFSSRTETSLDDRLLPVFEKIGGVLIILVGMFYAFDAAGLNMTWLAAGGAIGGLVIAFAAQDTLSNFFSGIHLLVDRPFKEGEDIILETGEVCTVRRIGLRSTHLYHISNHEVIIVPNNQLATKRIINVLQPDHLYKVKVSVGVAYGTDVQKVKRILLEIVEAHPLTLKDTEHRPFVRFTEFGQSSLDFTVTTWIADVYTRWAVASDVREMIERRFSEEGIEIPFPQRVIWHGEPKRAVALREGRPEPHSSRETARKEMDDDHA
jgi:MscS family membrane protein